MEKNTQNQNKMLRLNFAGIEMMPGEQYQAALQENMNQINASIANGTFDPHKLPLPPAPSQPIYSNQDGDHFMLLDFDDQPVALPYIPGSDLDMEKDDINQGGFIPVAKLPAPGPTSTPAQNESSPHQSDECESHDSQMPEKQKPDFKDKLNQMMEDTAQKFVINALASGMNNMATTAVEGLYDNFSNNNDEQRKDDSNLIKDNAAMLGNMVIDATSGLMMNELFGNLWDVDADADFGENFAHGLSQQIAHNLMGSLTNDIKGLFNDEDQQAGNPDENKQQPPLTDLLDDMVIDQLSNMGMQELFGSLWDLDQDADFGEKLSHSLAQKTTGEILNSFKNQIKDYFAGKDVKDLNINYEELGNMVVDQLAGMGMQELFSNAWTVDDDSSPSEQVAHKYLQMACAKLMSEITSYLKDQLRNMISGSGAASQGTSLSGSSMIAGISSFFNGEAPKAVANAIFPAVRVGDADKNGEVVQLGSPNVLIEGQPVGLVGPPVSVGMPGTPPIDMISKGSYNVITNCKFTPHIVNSVSSGTQSQFIKGAVRTFIGNVGMAQKAAIDKSLGAAGMASGAGGSLSSGVGAAVSGSAGAAMSLAGNNSSEPSSDEKTMDSSSQDINKNTEESSSSTDGKDAEKGSSSLGSIAGANSSDNTGETPISFSGNIDSNKTETSSDEETADSTFQDDIKNTEEYGVSVDEKETEQATSAKKPNEENDIISNNKENQCLINGPNKIETFDDLMGLGQKVQNQSTYDKALLFGGGKFLENRAASHLSDASGAEMHKICDLPDLNDIEEVVISAHGGFSKKDGEFYACFTTETGKDCFTADQLADYLKDRGFQGDHIVLAVCNSGTHYVGQPFAQDLANNTGVSVTAYPHYVGMQVPQTFFSDEKPKIVRREPYFWFLTSDSDAQPLLFEPTPEPPLCVPPIPSDRGY